MAKQKFQHNYNSLLKFSVTWSLSNHANIWILCSRKMYSYYHNLLYVN